MIRIRRIVPLTTLAQATTATMFTVQAADMKLCLMATMSITSSMGICIILMGTTVTTMVLCR